MIPIIKQSRHWLNTKMTLHQFEDISSGLNKILIEICLMTLTYCTINSTRQDLMVYDSRKDYEEDI